MPARIDIINNKFTRLTVLSVHDSKTHVYNCVCSCGNSVKVSKKSLMSGNTKSCGCIYREYLNSQFHDLTGLKYGRLTVVSLNRRENKIVFWNCICDCGNEKIIRSGSIKNGHSKSCGCLTTENRIKAKTTHGLSNTVEYCRYKTRKRRAKMFNITEEQLQGLYDHSNNLCYICGKEESNERYKLLNIDHDHISGKIRGLLCRACNSGLGQFKDNKDLLNKAATYLENYG